MKKLSNLIGHHYVGAVVVSLVLILTGCIKEEARNYNPYRGPLIQLIPKQIDKYSLFDVQPARGIEDMKAETGLNIIDAIKAKFGAERRNVFELHVVNFDTQEGALAHLSNQADKMKIHTEDKVINRVIVGKRFYVQGPSGAGIWWTNGSLACLIQGNEADSGDIVKQIELKLDF